METTITGIIRQGNFIFIAPLPSNSKLGWIISGRLGNETFSTGDVEKECEADEITTLKNYLVTLALTKVVRNSRVPA